MSQPRDDRQDDLFRSSLEQIINLRHPLVRLAAEINWDFLAKRFSSVCRVGPGQPPLPTRLVAGLFILKHMHNLSDEALCDRWVEIRISSLKPRFLKLVKTENAINERTPIPSLSIVFIRELGHFPIFGSEFDVNDPVSDIFSC